MSNDYQSGAAPSAQKSHAELIEEMRRHGQYNIDEEKGKPVYGILTVEGAIIKDFADQLDAAHKREVDDLRQQRDVFGKRAEKLLERCAEQDAEVAAKDEVIKRLNDTISEWQRREMATTSAVGNAAKLRVAAEATLTTIKKCMDILNSIPSGCGYGGLVEDVGDELCGLRDDFITAALAAAGEETKQP